MSAHNNNSSRSTLSCSVIMALATVPKYRKLEVTTKHDKGVPQCQNQYFCSLFFVLTTFLHDGLGDVLPKVHIEIIFTCLLQIISTMLYMIYVGEFSNIIQYQSFRSFSYYIKHVELQEFLKCNRVAKNLMSFVNKYALHLWQESRGMQTPRLLETAPQFLRIKIMSAAYLHHLLTHRVFQNCEPAFLRQLVQHFKLYTYNSDIYVVQENEITDAMYVIHKGYVEKIAEDIEETVKVYQESDCFGTFQGLFRNTAFNFSYRTKGNAKVLTLCLRDWEYLLTHFPKSKASIFEGFVNNSFDDDQDGLLYKKWKRVQITKHPGRLQEHTLKINSDRMKRFLSFNTSNSSIVEPVLPAEIDTQLNQTSQSLTEVLPLGAISNMRPTLSLSDIGQKLNLFPMNNRRDINLEDLIAVTESLVNNEQKTETERNLTDSSQPDDQANSPEHVESQINKLIDYDCSKATPKQSIVSNVDEQKEHIKEGMKEEKPSVNEKEKEGLKKETSSDDRNEKEGSNEEKPSDNGKEKGGSKEEKPDDGGENSKK